MTKTIRVDVVDDEGYEITLTLPAEAEVCYRCRGTGTHVNPAIDGNGISADEFYHEWGDEEREMYLTGGYDVRCEECLGENVVWVIDRDRCRPEDLKLYDEQQEALWELRAEEEAERRMGC